MFTNYKYNQAHSYYFTVEDTNTMICLGGICAVLAVVSFCCDDVAGCYILRKTGKQRLTFGADQTPVVADWTQVFEHEDGHRHHGQAHHKHHDPHGRAVGL